MNLATIVDPADPRLRDYRGVSDAVLLRDRGLFVAEGRLVVERVLGSGRYVVESVMMNPASLHAMRPALEAADARGLQGPVYQCDTSMFEATTGFNIHRGCLALVRRPPVADWQTLADASALLVVAEGIADADNIGSLFRNAAAFAADAVLLSPTCCDPLYRKAVRTSMGHVLGVPFSYVTPWAASLVQLQLRGFKLVALTPRQPSTCLDDFALSVSAAAPIALLVGSEGCGLSEEAEMAADVRIRIPMAAGVDSLNVAAAAAIALSRLGRV